MGRRLPQIRRIKVTILATETFYDHNRGCLLSRLCHFLNKSQDLFLFECLSSDRRHVDASHRQCLRLRRNIDLYYRAFIPARGASVVEAAISSYFVDVDVFAQMSDFVTHRTGTTPDLSSYVVAIGGEVVVPDVWDNEFDGVSALDAYSCLGNTLGLDDIDNNRPKKYNNLCYISMLRCDLLFPYDGNRRVNRGIVARYIIANVCVLLADKTFGEALSNEHMAKCVLSTYWSGVESEKNAYDEESICLECRDRALELGVADKFSKLNLTPGRVVESIIKLLNSADIIFERSHQSYRFITELFLVVLGTGVSTNLISSYDIGTPLLDYYKSHAYQFDAVAVFYTLGLGLVIREWMRGQSLP